MSIGHGQNRPISPSSRVIHGIPHGSPGAGGVAGTSEDRSNRSIYRNRRKGRNGTRKFPPQRAQSNRRWNDYADSQLLRVSVSLSKMQPEATEHHPRPEPSAG